VRGCDHSEFETVGFDQPAKGIILRYSIPNCVVSADFVVGLAAKEHVLTVPKRPARFAVVVDPLAAYEHHDEPEYGWLEKFLPEGSKNRCRSEGYQISSCDFQIVHRLSQAIVCMNRVAVGE